MARLPGEIDGRRFLRALARFGWVVESQRGSHRKLVNAESRRFIIVAFHDVIRRNGSVNLTLLRVRLSGAALRTNGRLRLAHSSTSTTIFFFVSGVSRSSVPRRQPTLFRTSFG